MIGLSEQMLWAIVACLVMMVFDIITGFIAAWENKNINSTKMREGLFHKGTLILLIILAWICELFVMHVPELGISVPLVIPACVIIFAMELVSITENVAEANPDLKGSKLLQLFKIADDTERDHAERN
ncbi:MAG: holin family protein [Bacteriophage sp.]|nr:MAG: holin family protein [Bacteriophage sp.]